MEGDGPHLRLRVPAHISIHALRVEGDGPTTRTSSLSANFNPRPPCGGRLLGKDDKVVAVIISIHALRVEGDGRTLVTYAEDGAFQSTPSVWRATPAFDGGPAQDAISIHALRVEGDSP